MYSAGGRAKSFQNRFKPPASKRRERDREKKKRTSAQRASGLRRGSGQWGFCQDRSVHMRLPVCTGGTAHSAGQERDGPALQERATTSPRVRCHHLAEREREESRGDRRYYHHHGTIMFMHACMRGSVQVLHQVQVCARRWSRVATHHLPVPGDATKDA